MNENIQFENNKELEAVILGLPEYQKKEVWIRGKDQTYEAESHVAIIEKNSDSNPIAILSKKYKLIQHREAFIPFINMCRAMGINVKGTITKSEGKVFLRAIFMDKRARVVVDGEELYTGVLLGNSVDGTMGLFMESFAFRSVCSNGMLLGKTLVARVYKIHAGNAEILKEQYQKFSEQIIENSPRLSDIIKRAISENIQESVINQALYGAGFGKNHVKKLLEKCQQLDIKNKWDLYNVITNWLTHELEVKWGAEKWHQSNATRLLTEPLSILVENGAAIEKTIKEKKQV